MATATRNGHQKPAKPVRTGMGKPNKRKGSVGKQEASSGTGKGSRKITAVELGQKRVTPSFSTDEVLEYLTSPQDAQNSKSNCDKENGAPCNFCEYVETTSPRHSSHTPTICDDPNCEEACSECTPCEEECDDCVEDCIVFCDQEDCDLDHFLESSAFADEVNTAATTLPTNHSNQHSRDFSHLTSDSGYVDNIGYLDFFGDPISGTSNGAFTPDTMMTDNLNVYGTHGGLQLGTSYAFGLDHNMMGSNLWNPGQFVSDSPHPRQVVHASQMNTHNSNAIGQGNSYVGNQGLTTAPMDLQTSFPGWDSSNFLTDSGYQAQAGFDWMDTSGASYPTTSGVHALRTSAAHDVDMKMVEAPPSFEDGKHHTAPNQCQKRSDSSSKSPSRQVSQQVSRNGTSVTSSASSHGKPRHHCHHPECVEAGHKGFVNKQQLQIHINREHEGRAPIQCEICNKEFGDPSNYKRHIREIHQKWRPGFTSFFCPFCGPGKAKGGKRNINRHMESKKCANWKLIADSQALRDERGVPLAWLRSKYRSDKKYASQLPESLRFVPAIPEEYGGHFQCDDDDDSSVTTDSPG